jgi:hypothetical protein
MRFLLIILISLAVFEKDQICVRASPDDVPTMIPSMKVTTYSDYPVSVFPSIPFPEEDRPFYEDTCIENNKNVLNKLYDTFGRGNCEKKFPPQFSSAFWSGTIGGDFVLTVECVIEVEGYYTSTAFYWAALGAPYAYSSDCTIDYVPSGLHVIDTYTYPGGSSLYESINFSRFDCRDNNNCLSSMENLFGSIQRRRRYPGTPPPTTASPTTPDPTTSTPVPTLKPTKKKKGKK